MRENSLMIRVENVKKQYRLGQIGGGTLRGDLQSWWARKRGKEDPNTLIGTDQRLIGTTFMALNGVSFTVNKGEAVGIIGSNGAGKSTLLKLLTHVTAPTSGDIDLYGRVASMLEVGTGFHPEMTGRENVYLNGAILGMTRAEIDAKMAEIIEFSEVGDFIDTPVKRYSSGMFVKLAFSVAAHLDSEIMIMDEVLAVGDMKFQKKCLTKMRQAARRNSKTVLYVSHNMATIRALCDRCIVLDKGKVVFDGDVDEAISIYLATKSQATAYVDYSQVVIVKKDSNVHKLSDLKGKRLIVQSDSSALAALTGDDATKENKKLAASLKDLQQVADYNSAFMNLESGMVDAIAMDIGVASYQMSAKGDNFRMLDERLSSEEYGIGFKKGNTKLRDEVQKTLLTMLADGTFEQIVNKWGLKDSACLSEKDTTYIDGGKVPYVDFSKIQKKNDKTTEKSDGVKANKGGIWFIMKQLGSGMLATLSIFVFTLLFSLPLGL